MSNKILIINDNEQCLSFITRQLSQHQYNVETIWLGNHVVASVQQKKPNLVIMAFSQLTSEYLTLCRRLKSVFREPIIVLHPNVSEHEQLLILDTDIDCLLSSTLSYPLLNAHMQIQLKRYKTNKKLTTQSLIQADAGNIIIDINNRVVRQHGEEIRLTSSEFDILMIMARSAGHIISRDALHLEIYRLEYDGQERPIDLRISRLRKKLGDNSRTPRIIKTVRNRGYLLTH